MALDWSQCSAVESVPGRLNGAWVFRDTRLPVSVVFEYLEANAHLCLSKILSARDFNRLERCRPQAKCDSQSG